MFHAVQQKEKKRRVRIEKKSVVKEVWASGGLDTKQEEADKGHKGQGLCCEGRWTIIHLADTLHVDATYSTRKLASNRSCCVTVAAG